MTEGVILEKLDTQHSLSSKGSTFGSRAWLAFERAVYRHSLVGHAPFPDMALFPWTIAIESRWHEVREELDNLFKNDVAIPALEEITENQRELTNDRLWKAFFFVALGRQAQRNIERCPRTWQILQGIPGLKTALFSIIEPGKVLNGHRGPYNGLLRYHLAVLIPEPREKCSLTVDGITVHWTEGKSEIFDDTYWHFAQNKTNHRRVVLFADFARPLRFPFNYINSFFLWSMSKLPYIGQAVENIDEFDLQSGKK